jgi:hypothetical protein
MVKVDVSKILQGATDGAESEADVRNRTRQTLAHQPAESKVVASSDKGSITC